MVKYAFMVLIVAALTSCGGGGGSGLPAGTAFLTLNPDTSQPGGTTAFNLKGKVTSNGKKTAITTSISFSRLANQMLNGEDVEVEAVVIVLNIPSQGASLSASSKSFIGLDGMLRQTEDNDGVICMPDAGFTLLPGSVMVGQSGTLGTLTCSDGSTDSQSYFIETSKKNKQWAAIHSFSTDMTPGMPDFSVETVTHVSTDGRIHAVEVNGGDNTISFELSS